MNLTQEEQDILAGKKGPTLQKVMKSLVGYGEALGAERFVDVEWGGHFAIPFAIAGIGPRLEMLDELVEAGLKTKYPFTLDPTAPLDFENLDLTPEQEQEFVAMFKNQARYDQRMRQLGLREGPGAYTCTPYLPQVGNIPPRGTILAWSESSCVVYANSVLAARTNRNAVILDLLSNILGKTPLTGFLTDKGRRATWLVRVNTSTLPQAQLLGAAFGTKVLEDVPYIVGLDRFLGPGLSEKSLDYLKEMGAACAAIGAVGLYHVENITPEAVEQGTALLVSDYKTCVIDDRELQDLLASYPVMWTDKDAKPHRCLLGCPHLSLRELHWWTDHIHDLLRASGQSRVAVTTIMCAPPQVLSVFREDTEAYERLIAAGVKLSPTCWEVYMANPLCAREPIVTNSNKLRAFTNARMFPDEELVEIIVTGEL
jgi:predicted aconitase